MWYNAGRNNAISNCVIYNAGGGRILIIFLLVKQRPVHGWQPKTDNTDNIFEIIYFERGLLTNYLLFASLAHPSWILDYRENCDFTSIPF